MLSVADRLEDEGADIADAAQPFAASIAAPAQEQREPAGRYGAGRTLNLPSIAAVVLIHAVLIGALVQARHSFVRHREESLSVVNLTPPPPPPPVSDTPPPPARPAIVAPPPIVTTPAPPRPQVATTPDPAPVPIPVAVAAPAAAPAAAPSPFVAPSLVQGGDLSAQMIAGKPPRCPIESRRKREEGMVTVGLTLGLDGAVESMAIARSSGYSRLDDATKDAARRWRWRPTIRNGQPARVKGVVEISFDCGT